MEEKVKNSEFTAYLVITVGTFLMAIGTNLIYEPLSMVTGGFAGIGIILKKILESRISVSVPLGLTTTLLNIPLFIVAIKRKSGRFIIKTLYGTVCFSVALFVIPSVNIVYDDYLMAAILGGALNGVGIGLVFSRNASTGGSDLLSTLLRRCFPGFSTSELLILIDGLIVLAGMWVFGIYTGLYSVVAVFVTGKVSDAIVDGLKFSKMAYIISDSPLAIAEHVMDTMDRGVTGLNGKGMYSGQDKTVLMCVVSKKEVVKLIEIVKSVDERAFVIVSDAKEVLGEGFIVNHESD